MSNEVKAKKIVKTILSNISGRSGCDLREIIQDREIYKEMVDELSEITAEKLTEMGIK